MGLSFNIKYIYFSLYLLQYINWLYEMLVQTVSITDLIKPKIGTSVLWQS